MGNKAVRGIIAGLLWRSCYFSIKNKQKQADYPPNPTPSASRYFYKFKRQIVLSTPIHFSLPFETRPLLEVGFREFN